MKTLFMETTRISPAQTAGDIQRVLGKYGASAIRTDYEGGEVISVSFTIEINRNQIPFRLPCRWEPILKILLSRIKGDRSEEYLENKKIEYTIQAKRIAWRQILRWIEAQLALVETGMVKLQEVFMPYLLMDKGQTIFEKFESQNWKFQLEHKKDK
jgi:hypothetical protein